MRTIIIAWLALVVVVVTSTGCGNTCSSVRDCGLNELCSADGVCVPSAPDIPGDDVSNDNTPDPPAVEGCLSVDRAFDADRVHLLGTLSEGSCEAEALAPFDAVGQVAWGLHCHIRREHSFIRPTDGHFIYMRDFIDGVYEFVPDVLPPSGPNNIGSACEFRYPDSDDPQPFDNDIRVPTAGCRDTDTPRFGSLRMAPDTGELIYQCSNDATNNFYDQDGDVVFTPASGEELIAITAGGRFLIKTFSGLQIDDGGERIALTGETIDAFRIVAVRSEGVGFHVVTENSGVMSLFEIEGNSEVDKVGDYPPPPTPDRYQVHSYNAKLDSSGALYTTGSDRDITFNDVGFRFVIGAAEGELIFDESSDPLLKQHGSFLVAAP